MSAAGLHVGLAVCEAEALKSSTVAALQQLGEEGWGRGGGGSRGVRCVACLIGPLLVDGSSRCARDGVDAVPTFLALSMVVWQAGVLSETNAVHPSEVACVPPWCHVTFVVAS